MAAVTIPIGEKYVLIDANDYELVSRYKWYIHKSTPINIYAGAHIYKDGRRSWILMHRLIMDAPLGMEVDHIDHDGLNNQRGNLRLATRHQNARNQGRMRPNKTSKFKGVARHRCGWTAQLCMNKKNHYLGLFKTEESAAEAYNIKAKELFGEFASLNQI